MLHIMCRGSEICGLWWGLFIELNQKWKFYNVIKIKKRADIYSKK